MLILNKLTELSANSVLAIGTFDGFHRGHQVVLSRAKELAQAKGVPFGVMTFLQHPLEYLNPELAPSHLLNLYQRRRICYEYGVDELVEIEFNQQFAELSPQDFAKQVQKHLVVVGENFSFGKNRAGNFNLFDAVEVCPLLEMAGAVVSSTRVRQEIANGNMELVHELLGGDYSIQGIVQHGDERGQILGFPTANLDMGKYCVPHFGAYIGRAQCAGAIYPAMINVGDNPTFFVNTLRIEAHLIGFEGDLYEKEIQLDFIKKLRDEIKFYNVNDLMQQLGEDKKNTCAYFENVVL